jgi:hypothetical protein
MDPPSGQHPRLRLVGPAEPRRGIHAASERGAQGSGAEAARAQVRQEMRAASALSAEDARAVFAANVRDALEGGRAAILTPERRRGLVAAAVVLNLRPFDANLIIAVVQDRARLGMVGSMDPRLRLVAPPTTSPATRFAVLLAAAALLAIGLCAILVAWVLRK